MQSDSVVITYSKLRIYSYFMLHCSVCIVGDLVVQYTWNLRRGFE